MIITPLLASIRPWLALSAAFALSACTLATKLGDLPDGGDETDPSASSAGSGGQSTAGDDPTGGVNTAPFNTGGEMTEGGDTTDGGNTTGGASCSVVEVTRKPVSPNVVLVIDKSGSMVSEQIGLWDHDADPNTPNVTRWSSLHQVVTAVLTDFEDSINFGAQLFPGLAATAQYSAEACVINPNIDIAAAAANKAAILAGIPVEGDTMMRGGTPTSAAVTTALDHLRTLDPDVPRAILLVTDGAANCAAGASPPPLFESYDETVHDIVADAFAIDGIPTYVVGVGIQDITTPAVMDGNPDDTNAFDRLNDLATEGGKPRADPDEKFFNTVNQIELAAALDEIAVDALTCLIEIDPPLLAPEQTGVVVDGVLVPPVEDCATENGWVYTNPDGPFDGIELCGSACAGLKLVGEAELTLCVAD